MRQPLQKRYNQKKLQNQNFSAHFGYNNQSVLIEAESAKVNNARDSGERKVSDSKTGYNISQVSYER